MQGADFARSHGVQKRGFQLPSVLSTLRAGIEVIEKGGREEQKPGRHEASAGARLSALMNWISETLS